MPSAIRRAETILLLGTLTTGSPAWAQTGAFATLPSTLAVGERVSVSAAGGSAAEGRVTAVSADGITIRESYDGTERRFTATDTLRVVRQDSLANGVLLGALTGPAITLGLLYMGGGSDSFGAVLLGGSVLLGVTGAVVGLVIDDTVRETVYEAPRPRRAAVGPILGRGRAGVGVTFVF